MARQRVRLDFGSLQAAVKGAIAEERAAEALRNEIKRAMGPAVVVEGKLEDVVREASDWLDVLDRTGRSGKLSFSASVTTGFLDHRHPDVRRFAARVVPEQFLDRVTNDVDSRVRAIVASRVPLQTVREMMKRFSNDDELRTIYKQRKKLHEAGLPKPEVEPMGTDPVEDAERMGDASKTGDVPGLSEAWYDQQARRFLMDYGQNIEYAWEELAVHRFCASVKATSLVEVDSAKLLKCIKDMVKEREDAAMERNPLKETLEWLDRKHEQEKLDEGVMPELGELADPVRKLVEANYTPEQYVEAATKLFRIQEAVLPAGIRKYRLGEGRQTAVMVPSIGWLPHGGTFRAIDERALDVFCESWSKRQAMSGEPWRVEWTTHPSDQSKVGFTCVLK